MFLFFFLSSPILPTPPPPPPPPPPPQTSQQNFDPLGKSFNQKGTFWISFSKGGQTKNLRVQIPSSLRERGQCLDRHSRIFLRNVFYCNLTCKGRKPPPESIRNIQGSLLASAISCALSCFITVMG